MFHQLKSMERNFRHEIKVFKLALRDSRTPKLAKFSIWPGIGYILLPFDIIPDFIAVTGHLDDVIIVSALLMIAIKMIPREVIEDCRIRVSSE